MKKVANVAKQPAAPRWLQPAGAPTKTTFTHGWGGDILMQKRFHFHPRAATPHACTCAYAAAGRWLEQPGDLLLSWGGGFIWNGCWFWLWFPTQARSIACIMQGEMRVRGRLQHRLLIRPGAVGSDAEALLSAGLEESPNTHTGGCGPAPRAGGAARTPRWEGRLRRNKSLVLLIRNPTRHSLLLYF